MHEGLARSRHLSQRYSGCIQLPNRINSLGGLEDELIDCLGLTQHNHMACIAFSDFSLCSGSKLQLKFSGQKLVTLADQVITLNFLMPCVTDFSIPVRGGLRAHACVPIFGVTCTKVVEKAHACVLAVKMFALLTLACCRRYAHANPTLISKNGNGPVVWPRGNTPAQMNAKLFTPPDCAVSSLAFVVRPSIAALAMNL